MESIGKTLKTSKKIVIKIGSNVLSKENGQINEEILENIVYQSCELMKKGKQIIIVSSGAGICGATAIGKWSRRGDMNYKQALCAIGQVELMMGYKNFFQKHHQTVGQILLTRQDFTKEENALHIRNTLFTLVDEGVVPIVNENDSVSVEEIKIGDNDTLSALVAHLWNADVLVCLSDIQGLYDKNPKKHKDAKLIEIVEDIDDVLKKIDVDGTSDFGTGGIMTKIEAAKMVRDYGIPTVLLSGKKKNILLDAMEDRIKGTGFSVENVNGE